MQKYFSLPFGLWNSTMQFVVLQGSGFVQKKHEFEKDEFLHKQQGILTHQQCICLAVVDFLLTAEWRPEWTKQCFQTQNDFYSKFLHYLYGSAWHLTC